MESDLKQQIRKEFHDKRVAKNILQNMQIERLKNTLSKAKRLRANTEKLAGLDKVRNAGKSSNLFGMRNQLIGASNPERFLRRLSDA